MEENTTGFTLAWSRDGQEESPDFAPDAIFVDIYNFDRQHFVGRVVKKIGSTLNGTFYVPYVPYDTLYLFVYGRNSYGENAPSQYIPLTKVNGSGRWLPREGANYARESVVWKRFCISLNPKALL